MKEKIKNLKVWLIISGLVFAGFVFGQNLPVEEGKVYVCPLATKMDEVNPWCDCRIDLVLNETMTSTCPTDGKNYEMTLTITEYEGKEYYQILGFESGGAGVNLSPKADAGGEYEGFVGQKILIDASKSSDPNLDPLKIRFDFDGDGNWDTDWQTSPKIEKVFDKEFEGILKVEVFDGMFSDIGQTQIKISKSPSISMSGGFSCECQEWGEWRDLGCRKGNCKENEMLKERERNCFPKNCAIEKEYLCVEELKCIQVAKEIPQKIVKREEQKEINKEETLIPKPKEEGIQIFQKSEISQKPEEKFQPQKLLAALQIAFGKGSNFVILILSIFSVLVILLTVLKFLKKKK